MKVKVNNGLILATFLIGVGIVIWKRKSLARYYNEKVWDISTQNRISRLHPKIRDEVKIFINLAEEKGIKLRVTSGLRTFEEQQKLYNQGRTTSGKIVTNAKPGQSYHNYGLAVDTVPIVNGNADWESNRWNEIGQLGKALGFTWGGDFQGTLKDKPHFHMTFGNTWSELKSKIDAGKTFMGYVKVG